MDPFALGDAVSPDFMVDTLPSLLSTFTSPDVDWSLKMKGLASVQSWLSGGIRDIGAALFILDSLKEGLARMLEDPRSALCKEVCATIVLAGSLLGAQFEPVACFLVPTLLKLLVITIKVIKESAHMCLSAILPHTISSLPYIIQGVSDKHPALRARCAEYFSSLLFITPSDLLAPYIILINAQSPLPFSPSKQGAASTEPIGFTCVRSILADPSADVRVYGKKCYASLKDKFPVEAQQFFSSLDPVLQKRVSEDAAKSKPAAPSGGLKKFMMNKRPPGNMDVCIDIKEPRSSPVRPEAASVGVEAPLMEGVAHKSRAPSPATLADGLPLPVEEAHAPSGIIVDLEQIAPFPIHTHTTPATPSPIVSPSPITVTTTSSTPSNDMYMTPVKSTPLQLSTTTSTAASPAGASPFIPKRASSPSLFQRLARSLTPKRFKKHNEAPPSPAKDSKMMAEDVDEADKENKVNTIAGDVKKTRKQRTKGQALEYAPGRTPIAMRVKRRREKPVEAR
eukprot:TRINITY_DN6496_c0_g1_i2.p1 TRINITY_DN6496_c0_g1~~TRINITY_DN6496_c0_g1_i2.p1  ORF type:complete len:519 (+),score=137.98 TRINITY_DN6496_c0_g1_i2:31-1557(+)